MRVPCHYSAALKKDLNLKVVSVSNLNFGFERVASPVFPQMSESTPARGAGEESEIACDTNVGTFESTNEWIAFFSIPQYRLFF